MIDIAEQAVAGALKMNPKSPRSSATASTRTTSRILRTFPYEADPRSGFANTKGQQRR